MTQPADATFYDLVGGAETFRRLVHRFYQGVADDPLLRPLYPEPELSGAEDRLRMFLEQYWGGPKTYGEQRGHPRLRMRHVPFRIGLAERDAWLGHMRDAIDQLGLPAEYDATLWKYLTAAADSLVNDFDSDAVTGDVDSDAVTGDVDSEAVTGDVDSEAVTDDARSMRADGARGGPSTSLPIIG